MDILKCYEIYNTVWKFFRQYAELSSLTDDQWLDAVRECGKIEEQRRGTDLERFTVELLKTVMTELERINK